MTEFLKIPQAPDIGDTKANDRSVLTSPSSSLL